MIPIRIIKALKFSNQIGKMERKERIFMSDSSGIVNSILEAVDIIAASNAASISFDKTIECEVLDNSDAKNGHYIVSNGSIRFDAYSEKTSYSKGNNVLVKIPGGDFSQTKYIESLAQKDDGEPITYLSALNTIMDVVELTKVSSDKNFKTTNESATGFSLKANSSETKKLIWSFNFDDYPNIWLTDVFTSLYIEADFKTNLVNVKEGTYSVLAGLNGSGKSTLSKIIAGLIAPEKGEVVLDKGERLSVLKQDHYAFEGYTVLDTVMMGNGELYKIMKEKDAIYSKPDFSEEDGMKAAKLEERFAELDGWNAESDAATLLNGLGIINIGTVGAHNDTTNAEGGGASENGSHVARVSYGLQQKHARLGIGGKRRKHGDTFLSLDVHFGETSHRNDALRCLLS